MAGGPLEDKAFPHDARMATRFLDLQMLLDSHKMHVPVGGLGVEGTEVLLLQVVHSSRGGPLLAHRTIPGRTLLFRNGTHDMKCSVCVSACKSTVGPCDFQTDHYDSAYVNT